MRGWLLDARVNGESLRLTLLGESGGLSEVDVPVRERLYLTPRSVGLERLADSLSELEGVLSVDVERWLLPLRYREETDVLVVDCQLGEARLILRRVQELGLAEAWNRFPSPIQRAIRDRGATACSWVEVGGGEVRPLEDPDSVPYEVPEIRAVRVSFLGWAGAPNVPSWRTVDRVRLSPLRGEPTELPVERAKSGGLADAIRSLLPHVVAFDSPGWAELALGDPGVARGLKAAGAVVLRRPPPLGIDLWGAVEWSRISSLPLSRVVDATIGQVLTSAEAFVALRRRYLIPRVRRFVEAWKSPSQLLAADRGGLVLTPRPGVYWDVYQLDFNSLYPSIIARENVSPETVNDPSCPGPCRTVPEVGHRICLDRRGLVSEAVGRLVERRARLRELVWRGGPDAGRYESAQAAVKWVLVACFGYLGYRNARFGSIEAYECVTALARDVARRAIEAAERAGYRVLHVLVDSLFVQPTSAAVDVDELVRAIERETGYGLKVEAEYEWVAFFSGATTGEGVPSRYLGRLRSGETEWGPFKVKGLEFSRRDAPPMVRKAAREALTRLERAESPEELAGVLVETVRVFRSWGRRLTRGDVDLADLVVERRLSRDPERYERSLPHVVAARGLGPGLGSTGAIRYVEAKTPYPIDLGPGGYSVERYLAWLERAARPFRELINLCRRPLTGQPLQTA